MPRMARVVVPGVGHHVTQRGNRRCDVFVDDADRTLYLSLLGEYASPCGLAVSAYCPMTNQAASLRPRRPERPLRGHAIGGRLAGADVPRNAPDLRREVQSQDGRVAPPVAGAALLDAAGRATLLVGRAVRLPSEASAKGGRAEPRPGRLGDGGVGASLGQRGPRPDDCGTPACGSGGSHGRSRL